jgi:hypothetical protein
MSWVGSNVPSAWTAVRAARSPRSGAPISPRGLAEVRSTFHLRLWPERVQRRRSASTSGAPPTTSGTRRPADTSLRLTTRLYGLSLGANPFAVHVAIVTDDASSHPGPDVVNGDGDRTGFSVAKTGTDQAIADASSGDSTLAGYVSPPSIPPSLDSVGLR